MRTSTNVSSPAFTSAVACDIAILSMVNQCGGKKRCASSLIYKLMLHVLGDFLLSQRIDNRNKMIVFKVVVISELSCALTRRVWRWIRMSLYQSQWSICAPNPCREYNNPSSGVDAISGHPRLRTHVVTYSALMDGLRSTGGNSHNLITIYNTKKRGRVEHVHEKKRSRKGLKYHSPKQVLRKPIASTPLSWDSLLD